jgi:hypothetical protein
LTSLTLVRRETKHLKPMFSLENRAIRRFAASKGRVFQSWAPHPSVNRRLDARIPRRGDNEFICRHPVIEAFD